jgi:hypothetical protein
LSDRGADNWRPLLVLAETAGGDWPHKARDAAQALSGADADDDDSVAAAAVLQEENEEEKK